MESKASSTRKTPSYLGCEFACWTRGSGPPVLFIQGTGLHGNGWLPQIESLNQDHACLWFDNRGIGLSDPGGSAPISVEQMALDAAFVMDAAKWADAHVVGHSLGGCIALELALTRPDRVRSLCLLCTAADGAGLVHMNLGMVWRGIRMMLGTLPARRRAFLELVLTRAEHEAGDLDRIAHELEPLYGHDLAVTPPIVMKQVRAMGRWTALPRLANLRNTPTLVVGASDDLIARRELVRSTAEGIPGANVVELPNAAHGVPVTDPETINALLRKHIARAESRFGAENGEPPDRAI